MLELLFLCLSLSRWTTSGHTSIELLGHTHSQILHSRCMDTMRKHAARPEKTPDRQAYSKWWC